MPDTVTHRLPRTEFVRGALTDEIEGMLEELGQPPLVDRIFPNGWRNAPDDKLKSLYDLCIRTFATRAQQGQ